MKEPGVCSSLITEVRVRKTVRAVPVHMDNTATRHVSSRTKHITLLFFWSRLVNEGAITIHYIPAGHHLDDIGTNFVH